MSWSSAPITCGCGCGQTTRIVRLTDGRWNLVVFEEDRDAALSMLLGGLPPETVAGLYSLRAPDRRRRTRL